jgi:hypothetical protein
LIAVAEDPIRTLSFRNLVFDVLEIDPALLNIGTPPLEFAGKIGQLSRPVALPDAFRDQRRAILRGNSGFFENRQTLRTGG